MENKKEKMNLNKEPLEFYDIIIRIDSLINVKTKGWEVIMSEKGKKFVTQEQKDKILVVGVLGNRNKGKSFILQSLSGEDLQTGTSVNTIGLSLKLTQENYILLDSAGSESPLLGGEGDIKDISRDKLFTENFIQTYIMNYSNVLLLVVGHLTFSEQKLIIIKVVV
jgi:predicted GTPase